MQESEIWKSILAEICNIKLIHIEKDILNIHTQASQWMLDMIQDYYIKNGNNLISAINQINEEWKMVLTDMFLRSWSNDTISKIRTHIYRNFASIFLHMLNGTKAHIKWRKHDPEKFKNQIAPSDHPVYTYMIQSGIKRICHGHTSDEPYGIPGIETHNLNRRSRIMPQGNKFSPEVSTIPYSETRTSSLVEKTIQSIWSMFSGK